MINFVAVSDFRSSFFPGEDSCISESDLGKIHTLCKAASDCRFIADLGDSLDGTLDPARAEELFKNIFFLYDSTVDVCSVMGERDLCLTRKKYLELNDYSVNYRAFEKQNYRCIFLETCISDENGVRFEADDEQIAWLSRILSKTHRQAVIFTHAPIAVSNPEDEDKLIKNSAKLREVIEKSRRVVLVVSGHLDHGDFVFSNEVPYVTLAPMCSTNEPSFAKISVSSRAIDVEGFGEQKSYFVPRKQEKIVKT